MRDGDVLACLLALGPDARAAAVAGSGVDAGEAADAVAAGLALFDD